MNLIDGLFLYVAAITIVLVVALIVIVKLLIDN